MKCEECHMRLRCLSCQTAALDHEEPADLIRGYADRGRILGTMKQETVDELYELANRIEQREPVL